MRTHPRTSALRIAIVIERFIPGAGGVENVAWRVAHELANQGEEVTVLAREDAPGDPAASAQSTRPSEAIRVERISVSRAWQPLRVTLFSRATARATAGDRFDVVHSFARTRHQDLYRAGGGSHDDYLRRTHTGLGSALRGFSPRHRVLLNLDRRIFRDPYQRIQCASRMVADDLVETRGVTRDRILLLPNAVDADRFSHPGALRDGARLRAELDEQAEQVWLLAGSGWRRKGLATALEAMATLDEPGLRLWVAGRDRPAPWRSKIGALGLGDRVRFLGERSDLPAVYQAVDGMLLPTRYDPFANVTLEAAAAGLPIITSAANGAAEYLGEEIRVIADAEDATALATAIAGFSDPSTRQAFGERAQRRARALDWAGHASALRDEYRRIVETRACRGTR
ncbi:MAG: glycosyltransferase family 4 protein [bacterium]|nr:glycosyltransferase family 4 protein [bacterium]